MNGAPRDVLRAVIDAPARVAEIPAADVPQILGALAELQAMLTLRLMTGADGHGSPASPASDSNLGIREAAERLGVSVAYLYRHAGSLPFTVRIGRKLLFSAQGIERWNMNRRGRY